MFLTLSDKLARPNKLANRAHRELSPTIDFSYLQLSVGHKGGAVEKLMATPSVTRARREDGVNRSRRSRGVARDRCALCLEERALHESHIVPEFFYETLALYDEKHRFYAYSTVPDEPVAGPQQKGFKERLLCQMCEDRLSIWETYVRKAIFGGIALDCSMDSHGHTVARGIDYETFKLFSMSLLWRLGVSSLEEFNEVNLSVHEERLRQRLLTNDAGRYWDYGFTVLFPPDAEAEKIVSRVIAPPERLRFKSHWFYRMSLGMTFWFFPVSNQMSKLETDEWSFSLLENGNLIFYNGGSDSVLYVYRVALELGKAGIACGDFS